MSSAADLLGTWRMLSWTRTAVATGEVRDALGPDPIWSCPRDLVQRERNFLGTLNP